MTFHCTKLCSGECCAPLRSGLANRIHGPLSSQGRDDCPILKASGAAIIDACDTMRAVYRAIDDPAKIADLIAMGLRSRGFDVACDWSDRHDFYVAWWPNDLKYVDGTQWIHVRAGHYRRFKNMHTDEWAMPTARAKLLAIMAAPPDDSSLETCTQIVRGET